jgi:hypothetical protein
MDNFQVPTIQNDVSTMSPKKASEEAFYASATVGGPNLITNYDTATADLQQKGQSEFIDTEKAKWNQEQEQNNKDTISGIIGDPTVSKSIKKSILQGYALTGSLPSTLKDKYIQKTAIASTHETIDDKESQDSNIEVLGERVASNTKDSVDNNIASGTLALTNILSQVTMRQTLGLNQLEDTGKAVASISASILSSIPAGIAGLFQTIKEQDPSKGAEVISDIQAYVHSKMPSDKKSELIQESILKAVDALNIPAKVVGDFINSAKFTQTPETEAKLKALGITDTGTNPKEQAALATAGEIALNPLNFIGMESAKVLKATKELPASIYTPKIPIDSPLAITNVANPVAAEKSALAAIKEPTGKLAAALGVDKGEIVHDWVLPKAIAPEVGRMHPDLSAKLIADIQAQDDAVRTSFVQSRYDPNILNATKREEEVNQTFQIMKESRMPYYNQSMSLINETDKLFEGNAVFGRNGSGGYVRAVDAQRAYNNLKESIDLLPEDQRGNLSIVKMDDQHYLNWQWKKEYDELNNEVFSKDSIQTSVLGKDVSDLARSGLGRWIFPTGRFPKDIENASLRSVERGAVLRKDLTDSISKNIASSKHKAELDYLINDAEQKGIEYYSPEKISSIFPKLSKSEAEDLFVTHTYWNRQQQYNHNFLNRIERNRLVAGDMQGLYKKDRTYIGHVSEKVGPSELNNIKEVWDFDKGTPVVLEQDSLKVSGRKIVRLHDPVIGEGTRHEYGLTGADAHLNLLPQEVLPKIPGYSGRRVKESWYVDVKPKTLKVNGRTISDPKGLDAYVLTKAATKTEHEGLKVAEQLQEKYPDHTITVRPERQDNFGRVMTDYGIHQEFLKHSMQRGERLPSLNGPARLEDRMTTLHNTTNSIARTVSMATWEESFKRKFLAGFSEFTKGEFPQYATDIHPKPNMDRAMKQEYNTAHAMFKQYERIKNSETLGDFYYTQGLHTIADTLEKWKLPTGLVEKLRGKHENPLMAAKKLATIFYIHLNIPRQWIVQTAQQWEMYAINPATAQKNFANTAAIKMYLGSESKMMAQFKDTIQSNMKLLGEKAGNKEFLDDIEAIRKSGMLQAVDMNSIVHGVFREADRHLVENVPEKAWKDIVTLAKVPIKASRTIGFDSAELTNRIGNWLQVKDMWKQKYPERNWKTKEAQEEISVEALKLSGGMNRAGQLPYQEGMASIFFQFAAINHKMLMNLIQDNATILNSVQRAKLAAVRFALFGGKYGIPGGGIAYYFIEKSDNEDVKKYAEQIKRGAIDYSTNHLMAAFVEPNEKPDLAVSKALSPYSQGFIPYLDFAWETAKLVDSKPAGPRYPSFGMISSFGQAIEDIQGWWKTRNVNETNYKQMFMEAAEIASGFNNYAQGLAMLGMRDKITRMGNKEGMEFTKQEAYAKMVFGIGTGKEEDLWDLVQKTNDRKTQNKEMGKVIYQQISNQINKLKQDSDIKDYEEHVKRINSFINVLDPNHFNEADKLDVIIEIENIDKKNHTSILQSIMVEHWKYHQEQRTQEWKQIDDILRRIPDPDLQKYMEALRKGNM